MIKTILFVFGAVTVCAILYGLKQGDPAAVILLVWAILMAAAFFLFKKRANLAHTLYRPWVEKVRYKLTLLNLIFDHPRFWLTVSSMHAVSTLLGVVLFLVGNVLSAEESGGFDTGALLLTLKALLIELGIVGAVYCAVFDMKIVRLILGYRRTEYRKKTGYSRRQVLNEKILWGEFLAFAFCHRIKGHKRFLFNAIVPKCGDERDFAEIDMICICESGIHVIEAKNRGGVLQGHTQQPQWKQMIGRQEHDMYNPLLQNQNHIIALAGFLRELIPLGQQYANELYYMPDALFSNRIFLADPECGLDISGTLPYNSSISGGSFLVENINSLRGNYFISLTKEAIDFLADTLEEETMVTPHERENLMLIRSAVAEDDFKARTYYFLQLDVSAMRADLYRFNSLGIARFEQGFWYPPKAGEVGSWKDRLPYCSRGYRDLTSFEKAREATAELRRMVEDPYYRDLIRTHAAENTLRDYLKRILPNQSICYLKV